MPLPCFGFEDALDAVNSGRAGCAAIPIENSQHGRVADIHFLLPESGLSIVGEHFLRINHALMAAGRRAVQRRLQPPAGARPERAASCGHAASCRSPTPTPRARRRWSPSAASRDIAAIAPPLAAELYGLQIVERDVEDAADNTTRFVVLARAPLDPARRDRHRDDDFRVRGEEHPRRAVQGARRVRHQRGQHDQAGNRYQAGASFSATMFYADIVGAPGDPAVDRALEELAFHCKALRMLGTYPQERVRG